MKGTLEKLRRMFSGRKRPEDDVTLSRFARSTSFKKASMRRSGRRAARQKAVVTNRGIYYVDAEEGAEEAAPAEGDPAGTLGSQSTQSQGTISYTDWIQISDDDTLDKPATGRADKRGSRNFSLEGKSVPFDSPLPGAKPEPAPRRWSGEPATPPADEPALPVTSTFGSSCTSGVHSMEKPSRLDGAEAEGRWARAAARRRPPTVVATRDNLRRSLRRLSGKKAKKAARRLDPAASAAPDDELCQRLARLPLAEAGAEAEPAEEAATPAATPRVPFAFSRQNPITRWLEESERQSRRPLISDTDRPLWSELVNAPPPPPPERARRPSKATKRAARARTPSRKSLRRKLKAARPRVDASAAAAAAAAAGSRPALSDR